MNNLPSPSMTFAGLSTFQSNSTLSSIMNTPELLASEPFPANKASSNGGQNLSLINALLSTNMPTEHAVVNACESESKEDFIQGD